MSNALTLFSNLPSKYVGFSSLFDDMQNYISNTKWHRPGYPAYDIVKKDNGFVIEMALAGFSKEDIKVTFNTKHRILTVFGKKEAKEEKEKTFSSIASRQFSKQFTIDSNLLIGETKLVDGLLSIELVADKIEDSNIDVPIK